MAQGAVLAPGRVRSDAFQFRIGFDNAIPAYSGLLIPIKGELDARPGAAGGGKQPDDKGTCIGCGTHPHGGIDGVQVTVLPDADFHVQVWADGDAGHAYAAQVVTGSHPLTFLDLHADKMAVEDKDVLFTARGVQLSIKPDDYRVSVEVIVGPEKLRIVRSGMDDLAGCGGEYRRADRVANVDAVMDSVAAAAGAAELVARAVQLIESTWKGGLKPKVCAADWAGRIESRPEAARPAWCTRAQAGIGAYFDLSRQ